MRIYLDETGGDLMRAVGNYHSHTPALNQDYQSRCSLRDPPVPAGGAR